MQRWHSDELPFPRGSISRYPAPKDGAEDRLWRLVAAVRESAVSPCCCWSSSLLVSGLKLPCGCDARVFEQQHPISHSGLPPGARGIASQSRVRRVAHASTRTSVCVNMTVCVLITYFVLLECHNNVRTSRLLLGCDCCTRWRRDYTPRTASPRQVPYHCSSFQNNQQRSSQFGLGLGDRRLPSDTARASCLSLTRSAASRSLMTFPMATRPAVAPLTRCCTPVTAHRLHRLQWVGHRDIHTHTRVAPFPHPLCAEAVAAAAAVGGAMAAVLVLVLVLVVPMVQHTHPRLRLTGLAFLAPCPRPRVEPCSQAPAGCPPLPTRLQPAGVRAAVARPRRTVV